jgi:hypothetical protein
LGRRRKGAEYLSQALQTAQEIGACLEPPVLLTAVAACLAEGGFSAAVNGATENKVLAIELYALAMSDPHVANSQWYRDITRKRFDAIVATIPADVVSAAQDRGRARDLETTTADLLDKLA